MRWFGSDKCTRPRKRGGSVIIHRQLPAGSQDHDVADQPITEASLLRAELQRLARKIAQMELEMEFLVRYSDAASVQARIGELSKQVGVIDGPDHGTGDELMALLKYAHRRGFIKGTED